MTRTYRADLFTLHPIAWTHAQEVLARESLMLQRGIGVEQRAEFLLNEYERLMAQSPVTIQQTWTEIIKDWDRTSAARDIDALRLNLEGHGFRGTLRELRALYRRHGLNDSVLDPDLVIAGCWMLAEDETFAEPARRLFEPIVEAITSSESIASKDAEYQQILASVQLQSAKDRAVTSLAIDTLGPILESLPEMLLAESNRIRDIAILRGRLLDLTISDLLLTILDTAGSVPLRRMITNSLDHAVAAYHHVIRCTLQERMTRLGITSLPVETPEPPRPTRQPEDTADLLTPDEAARRLGISKPTLWRLVRDGAITKIRIRGATRYDPDELDRYIGR